MTQPAMCLEVLLLRGEALPASDSAVQGARSAAETTLPGLEETFLLLCASRLTEGGIQLVTKFHTLFPSKRAQLNTSTAIQII